MDFETNRVLIDREILEEIKEKIHRIAKKSHEAMITDMAEDILKLLEKNESNNESYDFQGETLIEQIKYKMKTTKDKDLNLKLYILYRKLEENKISENEALKLYEMYLDTEYTDIYV